MPSRDAWDAAFCCGSNSVTRRSAMDEVGGGLPSGSITEDMLLSLALLRKGFVTRYVCERLAYGLAPESIKAFFVQRQRWARGAIQILFLPEGPLGKGMRFVHRLLFLPTHWLTQSLMLLMSIVTPIVFLWTDTPPLINVTIDSVLHFLVPMVLATVGGIHFYAQREYFPLAAQVLSTFQSFKILPTALLTLIKPHGHVFKVTPKGGSAVGDDYDRGILWSAAVLIVLTLGGMIINTIPEQRIVAQEALVPMVAVWGFVNVIVLFLVCMLSIQAPVLRSEERFEIVETVSLRGDNGSVVPAQSRDLSVTGAGVAVAPGLVEMLGIERGAEIQVSLSGVGAVRSTVVRCTDGFLGVNFDLPQSVERELLIRKLFTSGFDTTTVTASMWSVVGAMLHRIIAFKHITTSAATEEPAAAERPAEKLPAATLVIPPLRRAVSLAEIAAERGALAA